MLRAFGPLAAVHLQEAGPPPRHRLHQEFGLARLISLQTTEPVIQHNRALSLSALSGPRCWPRAGRRKVRSGPSMPWASCLDGDRSVARDLLISVKHGFEQFIARAGGDNGSRDGSSFNLCLALASICVSFRFFLSTPGNGRFSGEGRRSPRYVVLSQWGFRCPQVRV